MMRTNSITLLSPAKLNLYLRVVNKRKDGFHNLETLFERIDLCDELRFKGNKSGRITVSCSHPHVPRGKKNLVYQAAELLKGRFGVRQGVHIHIKKRIPVAAGLAGGSSNAATTLLGLNRLWQLSLSGSQLQRLANLVGSDIAFFLADCSWGWGVNRGDVIKRVKIPKKVWHILVVPGVKMYTREVFKALNLKLTKRNDNATILIRSLKKGNLADVKELLSNDLESSILKLCPRLINTKNILNRYNCKGVAFSGSGPSIFGLLGSKREAEKLKKTLSKRYSRVYAVRTL